MKLQYKPNDLKAKLEAALVVAQEEYDSAYNNWTGMCDKGCDDFKEYKSKFVKTPWWCFWKTYNYEPPVPSSLERRTWSTKKNFESCVGVLYGYCYYIEIDPPSDHKINTLKSTLNSLDTSAEYVYIDGNVAELIKGDIK